MTDHDFLASVARNWPAVLDELPAEYARRFAELVSQVRSARTSDEAADVSWELRMLARKLPRGHEVRIAASSTRYAAGAPVIDLADVAAILAGLDLLPEADDDPDAWLLAAASLSEQEVRDRGIAPERTDLIRLPAEGNDPQPRLPAFQFGPDGQPVPVVLAINQLLGAGADPWGAADWWLGENAWLDAVPADLIGHVADTVLLQAAQAVLWEE